MQTQKIHIHVRLFMLEAVEAEHLDLNWSGTHSFLSRVFVQL